MFKMKLKIPPKLDMLFRELKVFKRNKKSFASKVFTVADYLARSTYRATAWKATRFLEPVSKSSVWYWVKQLRSKLHLTEERKRRNLIAVDETCLKSRGERLWVWAAVDPETGETIRIEASWHRSGLQALHFLQRMLKLCKGKPKVLVDHGPWYPWALRTLRIPYEQITHGSRNRVEGFFSSLKAKTRGFNHNVNSKSIEEGLRCWERFLQGFTYWRKEVT
jgi:transposase-like protein